MPMTGLRRYLSLGAVALLLAGCPTTTPYRPGSGTYPTSATPAPTPSPSGGGATREEETISGVLYSEETGQPLPGAIVILDEGTQTVSSLDGAFAATRSSTVKSPSLTVLKSGFANLTFHGYQGGPLTMMSRIRPTAAATTSVNLAVIAPAGVATSSMIGISVKRDGHTYTDSLNIKLVRLSPVGTGSVTVALPSGHATIVAVGWKAPIAGLFQGAVTPEMAVTLSATAPQETYETEVPPLRADGSVTSISSYYLNWPGDTPSRPNSVMVGVGGGAAGDGLVSLPPATTFGLAGAYYSVKGFADASTTSVIVSSWAMKRRIAPGRRILPLLAEPIMPGYYPGNEAKNQTFGIPIEKPVSGANAYMVDVTTMPGAGPVERLWRLISLGTSTDSLQLPLLPLDLRPIYGLTVGSDYAVGASAASNPTSPDGDQALTLGMIIGVKYNGSSQATPWRIRP